MKKFFAFLLAAVLLTSMFVVVPAADDAVNFAASIPYVEVAPEIDGVINGAEYATALPQHSFKADPAQFKTEFDAYGDWDVEFYSAWDDNNIYFAWKVIHNGHIGFMPENDFNNDGKFDKDDYNYMWTYTCVQFLLTPGDPTAKDYSKGNNYLEAGLCLTETGSVARTIWYTPTGINVADVDVNSWKAVIDQTDDAITYEVAIPKELCSLPKYGTGATFGLTYAVGAQEDFNTKNGMLEWQDACLGNSGVKVPGNCAVVTFTGGNGVEDIYETLEEGTLPEEATAEGIANIAIDRIDFKVGDGECNLITDLEMNYNGANSFNALLIPVEGEANTFEVAEIMEAPGVQPEWSVEIPEGSVIVVTNAGLEETLDRYALAYATFTEGAIVKLFGYDVAEGKQLYTNVVIYSTEPVIVETPEDPSIPEDGGDVSEDVSEDASEEDESEVGGNDFNAGDKEDGNKEGGNNTLIITICICAAIAVVIAVVVVIVLKKKKN